MKLPFKKGDPDQEAAPASTPQGITAGRNGLHRLAGTALLIILAPLLIGFTYLITLREPALQEQQVTRIAAAHAAQQASAVRALHSGLRSRMRSAASSPDALAALGQAGDDSADSTEVLFGHFFPELVSLQLLPLDEMGTASIAGGSRGLRNHIEVDLVRRAAAGQATQPESFQFEGRWLTSVAEPVGEGDGRGVLVASIDNQLLVDELAALTKGIGRSALQLSVNGQREPIEIAAAGSGDATDYTQSVPVPDTPWQVLFTPSRQLLDSLAIPSTPLLGTLVLSVIAALAGLAVLVLGYSRLLVGEVERIKDAADKKSPLELALPELVDLARQLRRATLRTLRQRSASAAPAPEAHAPYTPNSELTNPLFQSNDMFQDDSEEEVLELDIGELQEPASPGPGGFPDHIFRAYDIRGVANTELTDDLVNNLGGAIGSIAGEMGEQTLIVGCDGRTSSARIKSTLIRALMASGRDVIDIGMVCTPLLYFATRQMDCRSGVMVTGSHNPAEYNGLKIVMDQKTIAAGGIQNIRQRVLSRNFSTGQGRMIREDIIPAYIEELVSDIAIAVPLKVVIDAGNGATSLIAPALFEELGCEVVPLHCKVDGSFPNHPPDTSNEDNLKDLVRVVKETEADFGVAFDGDGDRLALVTGSGRIVRSDVLLMVYAKDVVSRNPGADVVFDVKCSRNLTQLVTSLGGRPVLWKTGHAFMKEKMAETGALLGGEFSGHMFFGERWYGYDDGMYAAGRLAEILSTNGHSLDQAIEEFPTTFNTPEILIPISEKIKFATMESIVQGADFPSGKINTLDGLRVDFADGWGLVRASNTSAALTARFESTTEEGLAAIMQEFRGQITLADPKLELTF